MYDSCNEDARSNSRNLQGKGARAHTHIHTYARSRNDIAALTDAKARLLEFLPIEEGRSGGKCPPSSIVLLKAIFSTLAIVEDPNWICVTDTEHWMLCISSHVSIWMETIISAGPCLAPGIVAQPKNVINPASLLGRIRWNRALSDPDKTSRESPADRSHCERIGRRFISIISSTRLHSANARSNKRAFYV